MEEWSVLLGEVGEMWKEDGGTGGMERVFKAQMRQEMRHASRALVIH